VDERGEQTDAFGDSLTPLAAGASVMHETFKAYVAAGFTEAQALTIVTNLLIAAMRSGE